MLELGHWLRLLFSIREFQCREVARKCASIPPLLSKKDCFFICKSKLRRGWTLTYVWSKPFRALGTRTRTLRVPPYLS